MKCNHDRTEYIGDHPLYQWCRQCGAIRSGSQDGTVDVDDAEWKAPTSTAGDGGHVREDAPTELGALPDYWDRKRAEAGKDLSTCAAELRQALEAAKPY